MSDWTSDKRLVRAFRPSSGAGDLDLDAWPATVPAAAQLLREGLELPCGITVLVGENGSGKSTVVEILAEAYGLNPQGGSVLAPSVRVRETEPHAGHRLYTELGFGGRSAWAYFLRADTDALAVHLHWSRDPGRSRDRFHELSHGQGFLEILRTRINQRGFYLMDEPDAPLSFVSSLSLVALLHDLAAAGCQVIVATHSPIVAAVPGARILELGDWGIRPARWEELEVVQSLADVPQRPRAFPALPAGRRFRRRVIRSRARARYGVAALPGGRRRMARLARWCGRESAAGPGLSSSRARQAWWAVPPPPSITWLEAGGPRRAGHLAAAWSRGCHAVEGGARTSPSLSWARLRPVQAAVAP